MRHSKQKTANEGSQSPYLADMIHVIFCWERDLLQSRLADLMHHAVSV